MGPMMLARAGASLLGGKLQADAVGGAARRAANIARAQLRMSKNATRRARLDQQPYTSAGQNSLNVLMSETMPGAGPTAFQQTQDYQFGLDQGLDAINSAAAFRNGPGLSGAQLSALNQFGQDYASTRRDNWLNRLAGVAQMGQNAAAGQASATFNGLNAATGALDNRANALMAGSIAQGNAWNTAIDNGLGVWGYMNANQTQPAQYNYNPRPATAQMGNGGSVWNPFR